ncbi:hypothetical protein GCM10009864_59660 [Streptomyces lunalinharesii]|uniref:Transposase n=1 Tax=Streptomyces lunalinharesii TaxID=333384 RepID=A0ABP6F2H6_9ACTN
MLWLRCACEKQIRAAAPHRVSAPRLRTSRRITAVGVYLIRAQFLFKARTATVLVRCARRRGHDRLLGPSLRVVSQSLPRPCMPTEQRDLSSHDKANVRHC